MSIGEEAGTVGRREKKVFHGWYIVAVGFLLQLAWSTSFSSTLGVFYKPMSEEFGWPRSYLSTVRSAEGLIGGIVAALIGPMLDRRGGRIVMVLGGIVGGVGLILLGRVTDSLQFFVVRAIVVCIGMIGISSLVTSVAISNWFVLRRGRAVGISSSGSAAGKVFLAPLITLVMGLSSWRDAWTVLGVMVLVLVPLPAALFIRRRPEDMGLLPDGAEPVGSASPTALAATSSSHSHAPETVWTRREAARTLSFWLVILTFGVANIGSQGFALHTIPYLTDIGFSPAWAAGSLSILSVFQLSGTLGWGFIVERFPIRYCAVVMFLAEAVGVAIILWLRAPITVIVGLVAYGFSLSGNMVLQDLIWANYFGRLSLGTIRSIANPVLVLFTAIGPIYFGYLYDTAGSYEFSLLGFIAALLVAAILVMYCRPPKTVTSELASASSGLSLDSK